MNEEQTLAQVRELEETITSLKEVRGRVEGYQIDDLRDAGAALWAGKRRSRFEGGCDSAKASHARISDQIEQAISDCKSKQRSLAFSINPLEHPILSAQAVTIAMN